MPFNIDPNEFHFTPRIQRLSELEAMTRVKLHFQDRIYKFWDLQVCLNFIFIFIFLNFFLKGVTLKFPSLEKRLVDFFKLHQIVKEEGGFELCTRDRKWSKIAIKMGYSS